MALAPSPVNVIKPLGEARVEGIDPEAYVI